MKILEDSTVVPDILWYMVLEYKDKHSKDFVLKFGDKKINEFNKKEFYKYSFEAFLFFSSLIGGEK